MKTKYTVMADVYAMGGFVYNHRAELIFMENNLEIEHLSNCLKKIQCWEKVEFLKIISTEPCE